LEILQANPVDLVLADIKMPEMDGLELVRQMRVAGYPTEVIILSCHNEFDYVQQAIRLGASDYLFKPTLLPKDILQAIHNTIERIRNTQEKMQKLVQQHQKADSHLPQARQQFLLDLVYGRKISLPEFKTKSQDLDIKINPERLAMITLIVDNVDSLLRDRPEFDEYLLQFCVCNVINDFFPTYPFEALVKSSSEYIVLLSVPETGSATSSAYTSNYTSKPVSPAREIATQTTAAITALQQVLKLTASAGISALGHTIANLKMAYDETSYAVGKRFFQGQGSVILFDDADQTKPSHGLNVAAIIGQIKIMAETGFQNQVQLMFSEIRNCPDTSIRDVQEICANIVYAFVKNIERYPGAIEELYLQEQAIYDPIYRAKSFDEIERYINRLARELDLLMDKKYRLNIQQAIKFMAEHLGDSNIGLDLVADSVHISRSYFSRLFKETTGRTFIDYLTWMRMDKARELYRTTHLKVYEIAEKVGYSDWRYFTKVYKKYMGHSLSAQ